MPHINHMTTSDVLPPQQFLYGGCLDGILVIPTVPLLPFLFVLSCMSCLALFNLYNVLHPIQPPPVLVIFPPLLYNVMYAPLLSTTFATYLRGPVILSPPLFLIQKYECPSPLKWYLPLSGLRSWSVDRTAPDGNRA